MPWRIFNLARTMILLLLLGFVTAKVKAQDTQAAAPGAATPVAPAPEDESVKFRINPDPRPDVTSIHESFSANYSYVGGSSTQTSSGNYGKLSEQEARVGTEFRIPLNDAWSVLVRAGYRRFDFGGLNALAGTPQNLQSLETGAGVGYQVDPQWQVFALFTPTIQEVNDSGNSTYIHYGGVVAANYKWNDAFTVGFGFVINPGGLSSVPVLPLATANWRFAPQWTLKVGLPRSSLNYELTKQWNIWAGPNFEGGEFRTSSSYGTSVGNPGLNSQKLQYQEIRFGAGVDYKINPAIILTGEVGADLYRDFYFPDANDYRPYADPSPYAQIGLRVQF